MVKTTICRTSNIYTKFTMCEVLIAILYEWHEERGTYILTRSDNGTPINVFPYIDIMISLYVYI